MPDIPVNVIFALIAVVFAAMAAREYFLNDRKLSIGGKIRLRMAVVFAAISAYLFFRY